jgi:hypothetical protein
MSDAVRNPTQEYWRPAQAPRTQMNALAAEAVCATCGTEYALGARFCHVCGSEREPQMGMGAHRASTYLSQIGRILDIENIRKAIGLSTGSLILFIIGCACVLGAIMTGIVYSATTVLDWQAVQVWRLEWMLAAVVAFVMAILLKKPFVD